MFLRNTVGTNDPSSHSTITALWKPSTAERNFTGTKAMTAKM